MLVYGRVYKVLTSLEGKEEMYHTPNANNFFADEIKPHKKWWFQELWFECQSFLRVWNFDFRSYETVVCFVREISLPVLLHSLALSWIPGWHSETLRINSRSTLRWKWSATWQFCNDSSQPEKIQKQVEMVMQCSNERIIYEMSIP